MGFIEPGKSSRKRASTRSPAFRKSKKTTTKVQSIFEKLPNEILFRIFVLAGLKDNNLPYVNKHFYKLLSLNKSPRGDGYWPGKALLVQIINQHFLIHVNKGVDLSSCIKMLDFYKFRIPNSNSNRYIIEAEEIIKRFDKARYVMDANLFSYHFVSLHFFDLLPEDCYNVMDSRALKQEVDERISLLQLCFKALKSELRKTLEYAETSEQNISSEESMALRANAIYNESSNESEGTVEVNLLDAINNYDFFSEDKRAAFPERFSCGEKSLDNLEIMQRMLRFGFYLSNPIEFVKSVTLTIVANKDVENWKTWLDGVLKVLRGRVCPAMIIDTFEISVQCESQFKNYLREITNFILQAFYDNEDLRESDDSIWEYILQNESDELYSLVAKFSTPRNNIIAAMRM